MREGGGSEVGRVGWERERERERESITYSSYIGEQLII